MFWQDFNKKKPTENGWYLCTVEVPNQQRYVMELYWYNETKQFRDNRRQNVFDLYRVEAIGKKILHADPLCNRTADVVAWKKLPKKYMKGFVKEEWW